MEDDDEIDAFLEQVRSALKSCSRKVLIIFSSAVDSNGGSLASESSRKLHYIGFLKGSILHFCLNSTLPDSANML